VVALWKADCLGELAALGFAVDPLAKRLAQDLTEEFA